MTVAIFNERIARRAFIALAARGALGLSLWSQLGCVGKVLTPPMPGEFYEPKFLTRAEWELVAGVQDHLIPSSAESPGARECNATWYLDLALSGSEVDLYDKETMKSGVSALMKRIESQGHVSFAQYAPAAREEILRSFEEDKLGEKWLTVVMTYTLEAYLGDPSYGGNPDQAVWKWVGHTPGFPLPPHLHQQGKA